MLIFFLLIFPSVISEYLLNTTSGIYLGRTVNYRNITVQQYLGIEYGRIIKRFDRAEAIRGDNTSIINATSFGSICKPTVSACASNTNASSFTSSCSISYGIFSSRYSSKEQCLFLNVFIPKINEEKKAILMWIHGGSSQIGTGNLFDGTILAALGNIIVVTFNFRLNLFGFLSSGDQRLEGNFGLYDQSMVLDWIYENSDALGGDKERITVGGHSAGAPHAYYLAKSPFNQGRIRRLILQSGCPLNIWSHMQADEAMERFNIVADDNECGLLKTFEEKLECLREKDYYSIVEHEYHSYTSANHTNVVMHGDFMTRESNETFAEMEILMGSNDDEGAYVAIVPILMEPHHEETLDLQNVNFSDISLKFLAATHPQKSCLHEDALELYHIQSIPINCSQSSDCYCGLFYNYSRLVSDILFFNDYYHFLTQTIQYSTKTYLYRYSYRTSQKHPTSCSTYFYQQNLVGHFAELEYTWGTPLLLEKGKNSSNNLIPLIKYNSYMKNITHPYSDEQIEFSRKMIEHWSNFINDGQPNSHQWLSIANGYYMHLKLPQSELKTFEIPSTVQFWMKTCPMAADSPELIEEISLTLFFCTSLFVIGELI